MQCLFLTWQEVGGATASVNVVSSSRQIYLRRVNLIDHLKSKLLDLKRFRNLKKHDVVFSVPPESSEGFVYYAYRFQFKIQNFQKIFLFLSFPRSDLVCLCLCPVWVENKVLSS